MVAGEEWGTACNLGCYPSDDQIQTPAPEEVGVGEDQGGGEQAWHQGEAQASQGGGTLCPAPCQHPYPACPSTHPLACQGHSFAVREQRLHLKAQ